MGNDPVASFLCCVVLVALVVGAVVLFRRRPDDSATATDYVSRDDRGLVFDPLGPEQSANAARRAFHESDFIQAFTLYVKAIDRLDDLYGWEEFRQRQPSPADTWIVDGMTRALAMTRKFDPNADVREGVEIATGRLRRIARLTEAVGGNATLYRSALDRLAELTPDVDVSDIDP